MSTTPEGRLRESSRGMTRMRNSCVKNIIAFGSSDAVQTPQPYTTNGSCTPARKSGKGK